MATSEPKSSISPCPKCKKNTLIYQVWESSDGAYEDTHYTCTNPDCQRNWWVDGSDA